jgi:hypothetical protein
MQHRQLACCVRSGSESNVAGDRALLESAWDHLTTVRQRKPFKTGIRRVKSTRTLTVVLPFMLGQTAAHTFLRLRDGIIPALTLLANSSPRGDQRRKGGDVGCRGLGMGQPGHDAFEINADRNQNVLEMGFGQANVA